MFLVQLTFNIFLYHLGTGSHWTSRSQGYCTCGESDSEVAFSSFLGSRLRREPVGTWPGIHSRRRSQKKWTAAAAALEGLCCVFFSRPEICGETVNNQMVLLIPGTALSLWSSSLGSLSVRGGEGRSCQKSVVQPWFRSIWFKTTWKQLQSQKWIETDRNMLCSNLFQIVCFWNIFKVRWNVGHLKTHSRWSCLAKGHLKRTMFVCWGIWKQSIGQHFDQHSPCDPYWLQCLMIWQEFQKTQTPLSA